MKEIHEKDLRELQRIQDSIPKEWKDRLVIKRAVTPTMAKVLSIAMHTKGITEEQKQMYQNIKDSGLLSQTEDVENQSIKKKINKYVSDEIEKSIKAGRLSKRHD